MSPAIVNVAERLKSSMCKTGRQNTLDIVDEDSVDTEDKLNCKIVAPQDPASFGLTPVLSTWGILILVGCTFSKWAPFIPMAWSRSMYCTVHV
jgi:hypothetical protein